MMRLRVCRMVVYLVCNGLNSMCHLRYMVHGSLDCACRRMSRLVMIRRFLADYVTHSMCSLRNLVYSMVNSLDILSDSDNIRDYASMTLLSRRRGGMRRLRGRMRGRMRGRVRRRSRVRRRN